MATRRSSLWLLGGFGLLAFAFQKARTWVGPLTSEAPIIKLRPVPLPLPVINFVNEQETPLTLATFSGKHVLVNVWAKWCPPCKEEMPTLDDLQHRLGPENDLKILAISVDPIGFEQMRAFYNVIGVKYLALYRGDESEIMQAFSVPGLPTTVLIDHESREIGRLIGPTVWNSPKVMAQLASITSMTSSPSDGSMN